MYLKRVRILIVLIGVAFVALVARVGYLQIVQGDYYRRRAEQLLQHTELVSTVRGKILDCNALVLAEDRACSDLCLDYRFMTSSPRWIRGEVARIRRQEKVSKEQARAIFDRRTENAWRLVERIAGVPRDEIRRTKVARIVRRIETIRGRVGMDIREQRQAHPIVRGLSDARVRAEGLSNADLELNTVGVSLQSSRERVYPQRDVACHVIGITGEVSAGEQERLNVPSGGERWLEALRRNYLPGDAIGKSGVERLCEPYLRGRRGYKRYRRSREPIDEDGDEKKFVRGGDVRLTLDIMLQRRVAALVSGSGRNGCAVILGVPRSEVLALVSLPTYDLNRYRADYTVLARDVVNQPFKHRAVGEIYPPGSTMKPLTAVGALTDGTITERTAYICTGMQWGRHCWIHSRGGSHGPLTVTDALMNSCNIFFYHVGRHEDMGVARLGYWARQFGYSQVPGTGLVEEVRGAVPTDGTRGEAMMVAIGQSRLSVTPLHVANAMATLARDGEFRSPMLVLEGGPQQSRRTVPASAAAFDVVRQGMDKVVNSRRSMTAYKYFHGPGVKELDFEVCGKTGTAQTSPRRVDTDGDGRTDVTLTGNMVWFAGFAPKDNPKVAFVVMLEYVPESDGGGGKNCAPIAREALRICRELGHI